MATKRELYKPASNDKIVQKAKRKSLAQGRLDTDHGLVTTVAYRSPDTRYRNKPSPASSPGRGKVSQKEECSTPRRGMPRVSEHQSPRLASPSQSLELSDTEGDLIFSPKRSPKANSSVTVVDASRQTLGGANAEVEIEVAMGHSPARVTRHTPSAIHSNLRDTGDVKEARKIQVDLMPTISVVSAGDYTDPNAPCPVSTFKSPLVVRETGIAGSVVEGYTESAALSQKEVAKTLFPGGLLRDLRPGDHAGHHRVSALAGGLGNFDSLSESSIDSCTDRMSEMSDSKGPGNSSTIPAEEAKVKKKRKGTRVVESRFRQAASAVATGTKKGPMKATDRFSLGGSQIAGSSQSAKPTSKTSAQKLSFTSGSQRSGKTPTTQKGGINTSGQKSSFKTSTPTADAIKLCAGNMPAISPSRHNHHHGLTPGNPRFHTFSNLLYGTELSCVNVNRPPTHDVSRGFRGSLYNAESSIDSTRSSPVSSVNSDSHMISKLKKVTSQVSQRQLDCLSIRNLQMHFLESRAKKAFKDQEKNVMADLYALWELTSEQQKRKTDLMQQLQRLRHLNIVDNTLDLQESGLSQVSPSLERLRGQYETLSTALDTTRHQLPAKGVHIPDDEEKFLDNLNAALTESEQLLGELSVMSRQRQPKVSSFADAMGMLKETTIEEVQELARCQELLSATQIIATQESSLRFQDVQLASE